MVVATGLDQTFTMTPNACAVLDNLRVDGVDLGPRTTYTFSHVSSNHTIAASFVAASDDTITASAGPGGTISPAGAVTLSCGSNQTYTITPGDCYLLRDVLVDGASQGAVISYTFTNLHASHTIAASFVLVCDTRSLPVREPMARSLRPGRPRWTVARIGPTRSRRPVAIESATSWSTGCRRVR